MERARLRPAVLIAALAALLVLAVAVSEAQADGSPEITARFGVQGSLVSGKENTSVMVQNRGSVNAAIAMDIYTPGGVLVSAAGRIYTNVPPGGPRWFQQSANSGLVTDFRGVGVVSSDQPFNALLIRDIRDTSAPPYPKSYSIANAYPNGGTTITLPMVANNLGRAQHNTRFTIANAGSNIACVSILYTFTSGVGVVPPSGKDPLAASGPGGSACPLGTYQIPVSGQVSFAPTSLDGATPMPSGTAGTLMAVTITSTGSPVTANVDYYQSLAQNSRKLAAYEGFVVNPASPTTDDVGTNVIVPFAWKTANGWYTQILISNGGTSPATATITYRGTVDGVPRTFTAPMSIPANGNVSHSVYEDVYSPGSPDPQPLPTGFLGYATVTANQPVAALLFRAKMTTAYSYVDEHVYTAVSGVPTDRATTKVRLPLIYRKVGAFGNNPGYNTWVNVSVADGGTANVTIQAVPDPTAPSCGGAPTTTVTKQITGSFIFYQNSNTVIDNGFPYNNQCFWGGMTITSDRPIIAVANVTNNIYYGDNDGLYNGFAE